MLWGSKISVSHVCVLCKQHKANSPHKSIRVVPSSFEISSAAKYKANIYIRIYTI